MLNFKRFFKRQQSRLQLQRELRELRKENAQLRAKNESMRRGMRRCVTCAYRLDAKGRLGTAPVLDGRPVPNEDQGNKNHHR